MMNTRERFRRVMEFKPVDRLPIFEWATWWDKTIARWRGEGLPESVQSGWEIQRYFDLDVHLQDWLDIGRRSLPENWLPIRSEADYEKIRPHLYSETVDHAKWEQWSRVQERGEAVLWFTLDGFFWFPRLLLGVEAHFYAFYDQPKLLHRIHTDLAEWMVKMIGRISAEARPDFMTFAEDMSYNHGSMLSKELFDTFLRPYYERVIPELKKRGILAIVDSDGDITAAAPWFGGVGVDGMLPLERQAGVDVGQLRAANPGMRFIGCFDKLTMHRGEAAMRAEFERLMPTAAKGGIVLSCDHQTPPGVSLADYRLYLSLFREYATGNGQWAMGNGQ